MKATKFRNAFLLVMFGAAASGDTLVVPNSQATAAGNMPVGFPGTPIRIQEVIGGGQFTSAITIVGLRIRSSPGTGHVNFNAASWQITLSTTQAYPNTKNGHTLPSPNYANNVGPDSTVVFNGPILASSAGCAQPGPCPFDINLPLATPFSFDPANGRLLIDLISSAGTFTGSLDGVSVTDPTTSQVANVSGDPSKPSGTVNTAGIVYDLDIATPCTPKGSLYPCSIAGTLLVAGPPTGNLFGGGGGGGGGSGGNSVVSFILDSQNPGFSVTSGSTVLLQATGPAQGSFSGTLNLATVSGLATLVGGRASLTCGLTGNATATLSITTPAGTSTLNCQKTSTPGLATTVFGQVTFPATKSFVEMLSLSVSAPTSNDTVTILGYSLQASLSSASPSIITDGTGVINGGSYVPGHIVSGSWLSIKGSGFTNPGVTMDWSSSDFSKGLPTSLNGVQVLFNGQPGAVWYLIDGAIQQINVQAPANLNGNVAVQVVRNGAGSNIVTTTAVPVAPGIYSYTLDGGRTFYPSAVFPDGTRLGDPAVFPGARQAKAGDHVSLFADSLAVSPAGVVSVSGTTDPVMVTIGSTTFAADFSGLVAPGEFQINITVPGLATGGNLPISIQVDGQSSQSGVLFPYTN